MKKIFFCAFACIFLLLSTCKTRQKQLEKSNIKINTSLTSSDSTKLITLNSVQSRQDDSSKTVSSTKTTGTKTNTLEIHIKLDSNKKAVMDTTGNFDLRKLINTGLQNATDLIIKVTDQQTNSVENKQSRQRHSSKSKNSTAAKDSTDVRNLSSNNSIDANSKKLNVQSDSTVAENVGGSWVIVFLILIAAATGIFLYLRKRNKK